MRLEGSTALITGASRGLGLAIARLYARRRVRLSLTARGGEALEGAARELAQDTDVLALPGDVANPDHVRRLIDFTVQRWGRIDILINNASVLGPSPQPTLEAYPLAVLEYVFRVNAVAPLHLIQQVLPFMKSQGGGIIINVTSDAGLQAYPGWGGYGASKAALELLSRVLAAEAEDSRIRVCVVDPGDMNTVMHQEAEPGVDLSRLPGPDAVAPAFVRLIEDEPSASADFQRSICLRSVDRIHGCGDAGSRAGVHAAARTGGEGAPRSTRLGARRCSVACQQSIDWMPRTHALPRSAPIPSGW